MEDGKQVIRPRPPKNLRLHEALVRFLEAYNARLPYATLKTAEDLAISLDAFVAKRERYRQRLEQMGHLQ